MIKKLRDIEIIDNKLPNGLRIILIPDNNKEKYIINYLVNFGSDYDNFIMDGRNIKIPPGTAHFLEHKIFDTVGEDPFQFFSKSGTIANAYTSYDRTVYTLEGENNLEENLDFLISFVNTPNFTDENVEKEKGIIIEEINMYNKSPISKMLDELSKALFHTHPQKEDIGGTVKSVKSITKEILHDSFKAFYQPSNMAIVIGGKFDEKKVMEIISNHKILNSKEKVLIENIEPKEKISVVTKYKKLKIEKLENNRLILVFKFPLEKKRDYRQRRVFKMFATILFGSSSYFNNYIYENKLASNFIYSDYYGDNFATLSFVLDTNNYDKVKEEIINTLKNEKITEEDLSRTTKTSISKYVGSFDYLESNVNTVVSDLNLFGDIIYDKIDIFKSITLEEVLMCRELIDFDNSLTFIAEKKNK